MKSPITALPAGFILRTVTKGAALAAFVVQLTASAAEPLVQWAKVVGSSGHDWPEALALAPNGQVYLAGDINQKVLHRFDQNGTLLGTQASRGEYIRSITLDSAGNYYLTGLIRDSKRLGVGLTNDFYLAKYSSAGSLIWERTGGDPTYTNIYPWDLGGFKVTLDGAGNIYVAGGSRGRAVFSGVTLPNTAGGPILGKYAPDGTLLWVKRVEGAYAPYAFGFASGIALAPDGSIVVTGFLNNGSADFGGLVVSVAGPYSGDSFVAKYNPAGDVQWVQVGYGGKGVATDVEGSIYFNGNTAGITDMHCGKFDSAGQVTWERSIPDAAGSFVALDGKGEPVFSAGVTTTVQLDDFLIPYNGLFGYLSDVLICKADATGRFQWAITESGTAGTWGEKLLCDRKGNIYVAGAIKCETSDRCTGVLGSFDLEVAFPNMNHNADVFIARLFDADAVVPELKITRTPSGVALSWPVEATNHVLEAATSLPAISWDAITNNPTVTINERSVQLPITGNARFFRLRSP